MKLRKLMILMSFMILTVNSVCGHYNSSTATKDKRKGKFLFDFLFGIEELDLGAAVDAGDNDLKTCDCGKCFAGVFFNVIICNIVFCKI